MKRNILLLFFGLTIQSVYSQNKKEQIEALNFSIDSLKTVLTTVRLTYSDSLETERKINSQQKLLLEKLNSAISDLEKKNKELEINNLELKTKVSRFELEKFNKVVCLQGEEEINEEEMYSIQMVSCTFRNFKFIDSIYSDDRECLAPECHSFTVYKLKNGKYSEIPLRDVFNDKITLLEQEINRRSNIQLNEFKSDPDEKCYYQNSVYKKHSFKKNDTYEYQENQIDLFNLSDEGMIFLTTVEYDNAECDGFKRGTGMLFVSFTIDELSSYFAE
jgi:hypothetical protein